MAGLLITFFFWPFMIASIVCSLVGVLSNSHRFLIVAAILIIPMSLYLAATPKFMIWGLVFPLLYVASAISIKKSRRFLAFILNIPVYGVIGWLAFVVINQ